MSLANEAQSMPQVQKQPSVILNNEQSEPSSSMPAKHRDPLAKLLAEDDNLTVSKTRSASMPDRKLLLDKRTMSTGLRTTESLTALSEQSETLTQRSISFGTTELQKSILQAKSRLSRSLTTTSAQSLTSTTLQGFLKYVVNLRMKHIPHQGSRMDRYLKKAKFFAECVKKFSNVVASIDHHADEAARLIWRCLEIILASKTNSQVTVRLLERIFTVLDEQDDIIQYLGEDRKLDMSNPKVSQILIKAFATILELCIEFTVRYTSSGDIRQVFFFEFDQHFQRYVTILFQCRVQFSQYLWEVLVSSSGISFETIRRWLSAQNVILDGGSCTFSGRITRHEFTCEWLSPVMRDFFKGSGDMLLLTGPAGCGKSLAMDTIIDYARFNMQKSKLLFFSVDECSAHRRSSFHLIKALVLQLLEQSVGDKVLFQELCSAYEKIEKKQQFDEELLWSILSTTAERQGGILVVIDGIDQIEGGQSVALKISERLKTIMAIRQSFKCIILSRPFVGEIPKWFTPHYIPRAFGVDIRRFIQAYIKRSAIFATFTIQEREEIWHRIIEHSFDSFVHVQLLLQMLEAEGMFIKIIQTLKEVSWSLTGLVTFIIQRLDKKRPDILSIFSILLVSERPLRLDEIQKLLRSKTHLGIQLGPMQFQEHIRKTCGGLIDISGVNVHFINSSIKEHILRLCQTGKFVLNIKDAHREMALGCFNVIDEAFKDTVQNPLYEEPLDGKITEILSEKIRLHGMLEYSLRYYMIHYNRSGLGDSQGASLLPTDIKSVLSDSVLFAIVERRWWETQFGLVEAEHVLVQSLALRKSAFGSQAKCVLQSMINLAQVRRKLSRHSEALTIYYNIWTISRTLFGEFNDYCTAAAEAFIAIYSFISESHELTNELENIYIYLWSVRKHRKGETDDDTIYFGGLLVDLYIRSCRVKQACSVRRELYLALLKSYGALHERTIQYADLLIELLEELGEFDEIGSIRDVLWGAAEGSLEPWNSIRIRLTIEFVASCERHGEFGRAEDALRSLWDALYASFTVQFEDVIDISFIDISLKFSQYFKRQGKASDSRDILIRIWRSYEESVRRHSLPSDVILVNLRHIGELLLDFDEYEVTTRLFYRLRTWYMESGRGSCEEAILISICLSKCYRHTHSASDEEEILRHLFDILIGRTTIDVTTITTCIQLVTFYETTSRWSEAIDICRQTLSRFWIQVLKRESRQFGLPSSYPEEAVRLAYHLASLYIKNSCISDAESIHFFIFNSCKLRYTIEDMQLIRAAEAFATFYEEHGKIDLALALWRDLQKEALARLSRQSKIYIQISYYLARLSKRHSRSDSEDILLQLLLAFGEGPDVCGHESIEAVLELIALYERQNRTKELRRWYYNLWISFKNKGHGCGMNGDDFFAIYLKYVLLLQGENDISGAIDVAYKFRARCITLYGVRHILSFKALFELACVLEKDSTRLKEAIKIYEEICHFSIELIVERDVVRDLIRRAKARLAVLYTGGHGTTGKAETIYIEIWRETLRLYGYTDERSLGCLKQLISFYAKHRSREMVDAALKQLRIAIIEILKFERDSFKLFQAAKIFQSMYVLIECRKEAFLLLEELRIEFSSGLGSSGHKHRSSFEITDRQSFVFVLTLEELLNGNTKDTLYTDIIQDLMMETTLYESWMRTIQYHGDFESHLSIATRLLVFLERKGRRVEIQKIEDELWTIFSRELNTESIKSGVMWKLFSECMINMRQGKASFDILDAAISAALKYYEMSEYSNCYTLSAWIHKYVLQHNGWTVRGRSSFGFKLATCLCGYGVESSKISEDVQVLMQKLSREILLEVLKTGISGEIEFGILSKGQLNIIIILLGQLEDWASLEHILSRLWDSRTRYNWTYATTINIGTRLCEARFAAGNHAGAFSLLEDICYNVQDSFSSLDQLSIKCETLRAKMYSKAGRDSQALDVHTQLLRQILIHEELGLGEGDDYFNMGSEGTGGGKALDYAAVSIQHARLLKLSVQRYGKQTFTDPSSKAELENLLRDIKSRFSSSDTDKWTDINPDALEDWASRDTHPPRAAEFGCWEKPSNWAFLHDGDNDEEAIRISGVSEGSDDELRFDESDADFAATDAHDEGFDTANFGQSSSYGFESSFHGGADADDTFAVDESSWTINYTGNDTGIEDDSRSMSQNEPILSEHKNNNADDALGIDAENMPEVTPRNGLFSESMPTLVSKMSDASINISEVSGLSDDEELGGEKMPRQNGRKMIVP
jgi:hypothetical protein